MRGVHLCRSILSLKKKLSLFNEITCFFRLSGVDIQSQDAYELAVKGLVRPADPNVPMIYGVKCVEFNLPDFTIGKHEIKC